MAGFGGGMRQIPRDVAGSEFAEWADPTGLLFGLPTPEIGYEETPYEAFGAPQTREALANMRAQGPSPADLKTRAALDKQARALFLRGQTAGSPLGTQQGMAGGGEAQRAAIMAGGRQRAMEEQADTQSLMSVLNAERDRQMAASRAANHRRYAQESAQRQLFKSASEQDWDRMSKMLAMGAQISGNEGLIAATTPKESYTEKLSRERPGLWKPEIDAYSPEWNRQPVWGGAR